MYFSVYNSEEEVIRQMYFYETICASIDASTVLEMMNTNSEMIDIDEFSKWLYEESSIEDLEKWLAKNGFNKGCLNTLYDTKYFED